jgi:hypothetical protein
LLFVAGLVLVLASFVNAASAVAASPSPHAGQVPGYWLVGSDGGVFAFNAPFEGSAAPSSFSPGLCGFAFGPSINISAASLANSGQVLSDDNCVGLVRTGTNAGYWVANFGSLPSAFGSAADPGQLGCTGLNGATFGWTGIAATPSSRGFFLVSWNGGVLGCGDATPVGGVTNLHLVRPITGIASTPDGKGYWLVGTDGGVFALGDATFYGSTGGQAINGLIVGIVATPDGKGYWLVGSDGGVYSFGDATFYGSMGGQKLSQPVAGMAANPDGPGYWLVATDGGVFAFGGAPYEGSLAGMRLNAPIAGMTAVPN